MKLKRIPLILTAVFIAAAVVFRAASASENYYYAIADGRLFPATAAYMPMRSDSGILCPSRFLIEARLGLKEESLENFYTIYDSGGNRLTFDLEQNYSFDSRMSYEGKITRQNGVYYLPLETVAVYFGFSYSADIQTPYGSALRLKLNTDNVSDTDIVNALSSQLAQAVRQYNSINSITPPPSAPPTPNSNTTPSPSPSASPSPSPPPTPAPAPVVHLSFDVSVGGELAPVLGILDSNGIPAAFFAEPEFIENNHGDIRRIVGSSHSLGISGVFDTPEALDALNPANDELRLAALTQTRLVSISAAAGGVKPPRDVFDELSARGYRLWEWQIDAADRGDNAKAGAVAADVLAAILDAAGGACYVRLTCNEITADVLQILLPQLNALNAAYYAISESRPPNYHP